MYGNGIELIEIGFAEEIEEEYVILKRRFQAIEAAYNILKKRFDL